MCIRDRPRRLPEHVLPPTPTITAAGVVVAAAVDPVALARIRDR